MARLGVICLLLAGFVVVQAMGDEESEGPGLNPLEVVKLQNGDLGLAQKAAELQRVSNIGAEPSESQSQSMEEESQEAEAPALGRRMAKHHSDKSVAGGGVIIGGLVTTIFAAVFCYIRVTRRRGGVH